MNIILFDDLNRNDLLPLTFTRPVSQIRIGILTITEKWEKYLNTPVSFKTEVYLQQKYPTAVSDENVFINAAVCPDAQLVDAVESLKIGQVLVFENLLIAIKLNRDEVNIFDSKIPNNYDEVAYNWTFIKVSFPEDIFKLNDVELRKDFQLLTKGRSSASLSNTNTILGDDIFAEEGAEAECSVLNTRQGPIYLGKNSSVWEGSLIRGSFALCHDSQIKMGSKIYGQTTIGPFSRVGGEINNAVIFGYSSKGHDGYLGNSVLGEWCNIGADSNNSNLKNNYAEVKLWHYGKNGFRKTGLQFCGLIMADHAKCAINTMFNTGTVVGVSANVFGAGFPRNYVPDFSWGGAHGFEVYTLNKMFETVEKVFERRELAFNDIDKSILSKVFELTEQYRR